MDTSAANPSSDLQGAKEKDVANAEEDSGEDGQEHHQPAVLAHGLTNVDPRTYSASGPFWWQLLSFRGTSLKRTSRESHDTRPMSNRGIQLVSKGHGKNWAVSMFLKRILGPRCHPQTPNRQLSVVEMIRAHGCRNMEIHQHAQTNKTPQTTQTIDLRAPLGGPRLQYRPHLEAADALVPRPFVYTRVSYIGRSTGGVLRRKMDRCNLFEEKPPSAWLEQKEMSHFWAEWCLQGWLSPCKCCLQCL